MEAVNQVLQEIGAIGVPQLVVFNKTDRLETGSSIQGFTPGQAVFVSAQTGEGLDLLKSAICTKLEPFFQNMQRHYDRPVWTEQ
jgi:GTP-binding protein HflX